MAYRNHIGTDGDASSQSSNDNTNVGEVKNKSGVLDPYSDEGVNTKAATSYPIGNPEYLLRGNRRLQPWDHTLRPMNMIRNPDNDDEYFVKNPNYHFIRDVAQGITDEYKTGFVDEDRHVNWVGYTDKNGRTPADVAVFSGSTTSVNPHHDENTQEIIDSGTLSNYLEETHKEKELGSYSKPPLTPIHPFTRMNDIHNPYAARETVFNAYNRTKLPIADLEWRKGFRHIFFTRPECYLMFREGTTLGLCDQALYDEDFNSAYTRMPHIVKLLSPWYVSGSYPTNATDANWNFLLSNRVEGMSTSATTLTINENISKSIEGFTVTPAMHVESRQGSTIDLTFRDTKSLDVYEMARLWMLYMYKRKKGIFIPPYNGYRQTNSFDLVFDGDGNVNDDGGEIQLSEGDLKYTRYHPYDRALEYCASMYDIITNESGTKILYWCKYYGIYPTSVAPSLNNENNAAITDMTTSITFKYHYRLENVNKTLVEFNHDAGLTDDIGRVKESITSDSMAFLLRNEYDNPVMPKYIGASGMFTGSPYIVMQLSEPDPLNKANQILVPNLRFMKVPDNDLDGRINLGITNDVIDKSTTNVVGYV